MATENDTVKPATREEIEAQMRTADFYLTSTAYTMAREAAALVDAIPDAADPSCVDYAAFQVAKARESLDRCDREIAQRRSELLAHPRVAA